MSESSNSMFGILKKVLLIFLVFGMGKIYAQKDSLRVYPNPFNTSTNIYFYLINGSKISLDVYNVVGQKVGINFKDSFFYSGWHIVTFVVDSTFVQGVYFIRLTDGPTVIMAKVVRVSSGSNADIRPVIRNENNHPLIYIYPNPFTETLTTKTDLNNFEVEVTDVTGKTISVTMQQNTINTSILSSGLYFVRLKKDGKVVYQNKFVKY